MKPVKKLKKYHILFILTILLLIPTIFLLYRNISTLRILKEKPSDIVVANISTVDAQIYWKANLESIQKLTFKEASDTGLYKEVTQSIIPEDILSKKRVHFTTLSNLKPNTKYVFRIESDNKVWDEDFSFKTRAVADEVALPNIITGEESDRALILIDVEGEKYIQNTQYHGTWALDTKGKDFTSSTYANYITGKELQSRLLSLMSLPVHAQTGANCKTGVGVNVSTSPSKAKVVDILNRWVASCPKGGYPDECYEDVSCRALKYGINPAFAITIWSNESGGSNYANVSNVEDFGIHGLASVPVANFDKQIEHFLKNIAKPSYIATACTWDPSFEQAYNPTLDKNIIMWGARFLTGGCTTSSHFERGYAYMTQLNEIYGWYTNKSLSWPFTTTSQPNACSYASATTNTTYNSCNSKGSPTTPPSTPPITTPSGTSVRKWLPVTGIGNDGKTISPEVNLECKDFGWNTYCTCIWKYNIKPGENTKDAQIGQVCTVDGRVITPQTTPSPEPEPEPEPEPKACCLFNDALEFLEEKDCQGLILENIPARDCKEQYSRINILKGVNFLQAPLVVNSNEVQIATAREIIDYSNGNILAVSLFRNDMWEKIVKSEEGQLKGNDFTLKPGEVYLVIALNDIEISLKSINMEVEIELAKLVGWNLIPTSQFKNTSSSSTRILLDTEYSYIKQIAIWNNEQNIFDYTIRDNSGEVYGDTIPLSQQQGLFIKIP